MKAYLGAISGNSYKVKILLALLKVPHEVVMIDLKNKEHKGAAFLKINPRGEVPAIEDGGKVIWDSAACLAYIARKHGGEQWLPSDPALEQAMTVQRPQPNPPQTFSDAPRAVRVSDGQGR